MVRLSGAKALVEALKLEKVQVIFGIPGGANLPFYDALYDSDIRHILVRHEQSAAHMADGYARASGAVGVCSATSGPGATNLVTGIATAYMDSSPIVALTGQVPRPMIGRDAFQEADIIGITTPITKHNFQVESAADIPYIVKAAFRIASSGRPGPVLIDLPRDVQLAEADVSFPSYVEVRSIKVKADPHPLQVKKAAELLLGAERPVIIAGGGVIISNACEELLKLAELIGAPVATSLMGKGCIPENHPLSLGVVGMHGKRWANACVMEADVLLAIGTRFSDRMTGKFDEFAPEAKIIHVDIDPAEIAKNVRVDVPIVADAKEALTALYRAISENLLRKEESAWLRKIKEVKTSFDSASPSVDSNQLKPPKLMRELRKVLPANTIVTTEVGQNQMWAALYFDVYSPRTFISSGGLGTMGFGFPASLGVKVAKPNNPVVDIAGDGSFLMTERELATSVTQQIPVVVVILNNSTLGMVAQWQRLFYGRRYMAVQLGGTPNFVKLAEAYGAQGIRVESYDEFVKAVVDGISSDVTTVIDVPISSEENVMPMVPPGKSLKDILELGET
jgi:acetolactate synthase-1/2/3 large subunit